MKKPILYNGYIVARKHIIKQRIYSSNDFEIYLLRNEQYLVLFLNVSHSFIEDTIKIRAFIYDSQRYFYTIYDKNFSQRRIIKEIGNRINPQGLNAIAGMSDLKKTFMSDIIEPIRNKEKYEKFNVSLPNAVLLFGPPGCGKTYFVNKLAEELNYNFISTSQATFSSSYIHGTSIKIKEIFDNARENAPTLIFIDEVDALFPKRESLGAQQNYKQEEINEFLIQLNNLSKDGVIVIAATNRPHLIDDALLRTGRMDKLIYVGMPDYESRIHLFKYYFRNRPTLNINYEKLSKNTEGFASSDIAYISNEASKLALSLNKEYIEMEDIIVALGKARPSVSPEALIEYKKFESLVRL